MDPRTRDGSPESVDTKHLEWFLASEPLLDELRRRDDCEIHGEPAPIRFDEVDELLDALPGLTTG